MIKQAELSAALALGWSLLVTLGLASVGLMTGMLFGTRNLSLVVGACFELALMLPAARFIGRLYVGSDRAQALATIGTSPLELLIGASLGVLLQMPAGYVSALLERRFPTPPEKLAAQLSQLTPETPLLGALMFAAVAMLVPFAEELFFRGALFTALSRSSPPFVTVWTTSLAFTLAHLEPRNWAPLFLVALVLGELRRRGGSIWAGVALHAAFNAATLGFVFVTRPVQLKPAESDWRMAVVGAALCVVGVWLFGRVAARRLAAEARR
ncbi:MAG TPA: type II CAAX endopeptidase family protein [Polyangiaceae bacterium]|nr:type II CAAX endopeptidase family protein [Polyangiaceae bacterium]